MEKKEKIARRIEMSTCMEKEINCGGRENLEPFLE